MTFLESNISVYKTNLLNIQGRASRSEYWWSALGMFLILIAVTFIGIIPTLISASLAWIQLTLFVIAMIFVTIGNVTVSIRRLHDMNRPTWWIVFGCVASFTGILAIIWLIFMSLKGTDGDNDFGAKPL